MFFGSFWQNFGYMNMPSQLDKLLDKKDVSLEQILDEESFSQEVRNNSKKFSEHLIKNPKMLLQLIDFVIKEPREDQEDKYKFKYPFLTSELFHSNPNELINYLLGIKDENSSAQDDEDHHRGSDDSHHKGSDEDDNDYDNNDNLEEERENHASHKDKIQDDPNNNFNQISNQIDSNLNSDDKPDEENLEKEPIQEAKEEIQSEQQQQNEQKQENIELQQQQQNQPDQEQIEQNNEEAQENKEIEKKESGQEQSEQIEEIQAEQQEKEKDQEKEKQTNEEKPQTQTNNFFIGEEVVVGQGLQDPTIENEDQSGVEKEEDEEDTIKKQSKQVQSEEKVQNEDENKKENEEKDEDEVKQKEDQKDENKNIQQEQKEEQIEVEDLDKQEQEKDIQPKVVQKQQQQQQKPLTYKDILSHIFTFFRVEVGKKLNATNCGYFLKLISMLITKTGQLWDYFNENKEVLPQVVKHLYNKSISEMVLKLLIQEGIQKQENDQDEGEDFYQEPRVELLKRVLNEFKQCDETDDETHDNISHILSEILMGAASNTERNQNKFYVYMATELVSDQWKNVFLEKSQRETTKGAFYSVYFSLSVLSQIIQYQVAEKKNQLNDQEDDTVQQDSDEWEFFVKNFNKFIEIFKNQDNNENKRFGQIKLKLVEIWLQLIKVNDKSLNDKFIESQILDTLLDQFEIFPNHNIFHSLLDQIIETILKQDDQYLKENLLQTKYFVQLCQKVQIQYQKEQNDENNKNKTFQGETKFSDKLAIQINQRTIKKPQSGFEMKFLQYLFDSKNRLQGNNNTLESNLKNIEKEFYNKISNLNKYTLGGEENSHNDISYDLENHNDNDYNSNNNNQNQNDDDDDDTENIQHIALDDLTNEHEQHNKNSSSPNFHHIQHDPSLDIMVDKKVEEVQEAIKEEIKEDERYNSNVFWKQEVQYSLEELQKENYD